MRLLIYLSLPYPLHLARLLCIYYAHTIAGSSVLAPSPQTYLMDLITAYVYMYVLFTPIQLWSFPEKSGSMTSTAL